MHCLLCGFWWLGNSGVLRAVAGFTPVLDCFVLLAVGGWLMRTGAAYPQRSDSPSKRCCFLRVHLVRPSAGGPVDATNGELSLSTFGLLELNSGGICHKQVDLGKPGKSGIFHVFTFRIAKNVRVQKVHFFPR